MREYYPLLIVGAVIGCFSIFFVLAYALIKNKKSAIGFERTMKDGEIIRRLAKYAKPFIGNFLIVLLLMVFSVAYDLISPLLVGNLE